MAPATVRLAGSLDKALNDLCPDWPFCCMYTDYSTAGWTQEHEWVTADLTKGFYCIPIHPDHRKYFCIVAEGEDGQPEYYQLNRLPMGWKLAPAYFSAQTAAVREIIEALALHLGSDGELETFLQTAADSAKVDHHLVKAVFYVDDLILRVHRSVAERARRGAHLILTLLHLPTNDKGDLAKEGGCSPKAVALGLELDSAALTVSVRRDRLYATLVLFRLAMLGATFIVSHYDSLVGRLSWLAENSYGGRLLMPGLYFPLTRA